MILLILLRVNAPHTFIKCLGFNSGVCRDIKFFGAFCLCPILGSTKKDFTDSFSAYILRHMDAREVEIFLCAAKQIRFDRDKAFERIFFEFIAKGCVDKTASLNGIF